MSISACPYCGVYHATMCHRVKTIEYHQNGTVKRVELHPLMSVTAYRTPEDRMSASDPSVNAAPSREPKFITYKTK